MSVCCWPSARCETEVNSGGFDFYLRHPYRKNAPIAAEAARVAGCPALAALIEEAIALVGRDELHPDHEDALYDRLERVEDDLADLVSASTTWRRPSISTQL